MWKVFCDTSGGGAPPWVASRGFGVAIGVSRATWWYDESEVKQGGYRRMQQVGVVAVRGGGSGASLVASSTRRTATGRDGAVDNAAWRHSRRFTQLIDTISGGPAAVQRARDCPYANPPLLHPLLTFLPRQGRTCNHSLVSCCQLTVFRAAPNFRSIASWLTARVGTRRLHRNHDHQLTRHEDLRFPITRVLRCCWRRVHSFAPRHSYEHLIPSNIAQLLVRGLTAPTQQQHHDRHARFEHIAHDPQSPHFPAT